MDARTFNLEIRNGAPAQSRYAAPVFVLVDDAAQEAPIRPAQARPALPRLIDEQAIGTMRDLVLGSFLGAQFFHESDGSYVAPMTTENTRDAFPRALLDELGECITTDGPAGRLPADYVASLARGTTRVIASETRPKKKGAIPLGPLAFQDAHIVREVGNLVPEHGQWLRFAYGDSKAWDDEQGVVVALWGRVEPLLGKMQARTLQRVRSLTHLAVQSGKSRLNSGKEVHKTTRLCELLGVTSQNNWHQHWAPRWKMFGEQLEQLDREALIALSGRLGGYEFVILDRGV